MAKRRLPHESITEDRVTAMCMRQLTTLDNPGICLACGVRQMAVSLMQRTTHVSHVVSHV